MTRVTLFLLTLWVSTSYADVAPAKPMVKLENTPKRVLFVGNSFSYYNQGIQSHLDALVNVSDLSIKGETRFRLSSLSGAGLYEQQIKHLLTPNNRIWDRVVLQGHSQEPINQYAQAFAKNAKRLVKDIRDSGAQATLFMTWGYKGNKQMTQALAKAYIELANQLNVLVVPVGLAFAEAQQRHPEIPLFVEDVKGINDSGNLTYWPDIKHPSEAGTYLAASVFFSTFYQRTALGSPYQASLSQQEAEKLQQTAWDTVRAFYGVEHQTETTK